MQTSHCITNGTAYEIHSFFINNACYAATTLLQISGEASLMFLTKMALLHMASK